MVPASEPITVLLVDGNEVSRAGLRWFFGRDPRFRVVAEGSAGAAALARQFQPELIVLHPAPAGQPDLRILDEIRAAAPGAAIVIITDSSDLDPFMATVGKGALGYFLTTSIAQGEALLDALVPIARLHVGSTDPAIAVLPGRVWNGDSSSRPGYGDPAAHRAAAGDPGPEGAGP